MAVIRSLFIFATSFATGAVLSAQDANEGRAEKAFARVDSAVELQVFPTQISPRYAETLQAGVGIRVGQQQGDFREVLLPLGVLGYVHKKFTSDIESGVVKSKVKKLAFRYRAQTGEAPVAFVDESTEFRVAGEAGDWWRVRYAAGSAWVPNASLVTFENGAENATLSSSYAELERLHRKACDDVAAAIVAERAAVALATEQEQELGKLRERFREEVGKPVAEQQFEQIRADVEALVAKLKEGESFHVAATRLRDSIDMQVTIVEATKIAASEPKPAVVKVPSTVPAPDPLERFAAIGWLRYRESFTGGPTIVLEKGDQVLYRVTCTSKRYDLEMFDGLEVGLNGPRTRPALESMRELDVERIEVLNAK